MHPLGSRDSGDRCSADLVGQLSATRGKAEVLSEAPSFIVFFSLDDLGALADLSHASQSSSRLQVMSAYTTCGSALLLARLSLTSPVRCLIAPKKSPTSCEETVKSKRLLPVSSTILCRVMTKLSWLVPHTKRQRRTAAVDWSLVKLFHPVIGDEQIVC